MIEYSMPWRKVKGQIHQGIHARGGKVRIRDKVEYERKRQQIIDAALVVFAEKGFDGATNEEIARAAGIGSSALLYYYFKDKAGLLRQVVEARSPALQEWGSEDALLAVSPREALMTFASGLLGRLSDARNVALFRVMLSEATRRPPVADAWTASVSGRTLESLSRYLAAQMDAGVLRRMDVGAAARCFVGPLFLYAMTCEILPVGDSQTLTAESMAAAAVDVFLAGMIEVARSGK